MINREALQGLVDQNLSKAQIARRLGETHGTVAYWVEKYNMKPASERCGRKSSDTRLEQLLEVRIAILRLEHKEKQLIKEMMQRDPSDKP